MYCAGLGDARRHEMYIRTASAPSARLSRSARSGSRSVRPRNVALSSITDIWVGLAPAGAGVIATPIRAAVAAIVRRRIRAMARRYGLSKYLILRPAAAVRLGNVSPLGLAHVVR